MTFPRPWSILVLIPWLFEKCLKFQKFHDFSMAVAALFKVRHGHQAGFGFTEPAFKGISELLSEQQGIQSRYAHWSYGYYLPWLDVPALSVISCLRTVNPKYAGQVKMPSRGLPLHSIKCPAESCKCRTVLKFFVTTLHLGREVGGSAEVTSLPPVLHHILAASLVH